MSGGKVRSCWVAAAVLVCVTGAACSGDVEVDAVADPAAAEDGRGVDHWTVSGEGAEMLAVGDGLVFVYGFETSLVELSSGEVLATEVFDGLDGPPAMESDVERFRVGAREVFVRAEDHRILADPQEDPPMLQSGAPAPPEYLSIVSVGQYSIENSLEGAVIRHSDGSEWRFPVEEPLFDERAVAMGDWVVLGMSDPAGTVLAIDLSSRRGLDAAAAEWVEMYPPSPPPPMDGGPEAIALVSAAATEYVAALKGLDLERLRRVVSAECWVAQKAQYEDALASATPEDLAELAATPLPVPEVLSIDGDVARVALEGWGGEAVFTLRDGAWVLDTGPC